MSRGLRGGDNGTAFSITTHGALKVIHTFAGGRSDGSKRKSTLLLVGNKLFGTTAKGGSNDSGTIYSITGFYSDAQRLSSRRFHALVL
jgi:uncharacterized repeat protein (TIGR03803 family)